MGLTDLLKSLTRASALGLVLYSCGGEENKARIFDPCNAPGDCSSLGVSGYGQDAVCLPSPYDSGRTNFCTYPCFVSSNPSISFFPEIGKCEPGAGAGCVSSAEPSELPSCCYVTSVRRDGEHFDGYCLPYSPEKNGQNGNSSVNICEEYKEMCPQKDFSVNECREYCNESSSPRDQPDADCAFIACAVEVGICDNEQKEDPEIISCAREYGWSK